MIVGRPDADRAGARPLSPLRRNAFQTTASNGRAAQFYCSEKLHDGRPPPVHLKKAEGKDLGKPGLNRRTGSYHDSPHIFRIEELLSRYHAFGCHDKTITTDEDGEQLIIRGEGETNSTLPEVDF